MLDDLGATFLEKQDAERPHRAHDCKLSQVLLPLLMCPACSMSFIRASSSASGGAAPQADSRVRINLIASPKSQLEGTSRKKERESHAPVAPSLGYCA